MQARHHDQLGDSRYLLLDDVLPEACFEHDDDAGGILAVLCEDHRDDLSAYGRGGRA